MLQIFLVFLTTVTFVLMAADPRPADSTEAKSVWNEPAKGSEIQTTKNPVKQRDSQDSTSG